MAVDQYAELATFVAIAEHGSIARAGTAIGLSASQVSRTLTRLEGRLGVRLMHRTTRRIALTEEGRALFERARLAFADLDEAEAAVGEVLGTPRGRLRVTLPVLFGHRFVVPLAARYAAIHPLITVDLSFDDRKVDLVEEGYDLAVRVGLEEDPTLIARRLATTRILVVASPGYTSLSGSPNHPRQLAEHDVLLHASEIAAPSWNFRNSAGEITVRLRPSRFTANSGYALREAAMRGLGIARLPDFMVSDELRSGALVRLLEPWERELAIAAVYPPGRYLAPKVRGFVDLLSAEISALRWD